MLQDIYDSEPLVKETFDEADAAMEPLLGRPLTSFIYTSGSEEELKQAEQELKNTAITQPAMLTANVAILRVLAKFGVTPDFAIGHSLGEYAALVAAGVLGFADALQIVSARGQAMTVLEAPDKGCMAAVSAPLARVKEIIAAIDDYVVIANINSPVQCVLGAVPTVRSGANALKSDSAVKIPSLAFHTKIVSPPADRCGGNRDASDQPAAGRSDCQCHRRNLPDTRDEIINMLATQVTPPYSSSSMERCITQTRVSLRAGETRWFNRGRQLKQHPDVIIIDQSSVRAAAPASEKPCAPSMPRASKARMERLRLMVEIAVPTTARQ